MLNGGHNRAILEWWVGLSMLESIMHLKKIDTEDFKNRDSTYWFEMRDYKLKIDQIKNVNRLNRLKFYSQSDYFRSISWSSLLAN